MVTGRPGRAMRKQLYIEGVADVICDEPPVDAKTKTYSLDFAIGEGVDCGTDPALSKLADWTVLAWIKPTDAGTPFIFNAYDNGVNKGFEFFLNAGKLGFFVTGLGGTQVLDSTDAVAQDEWGYVGLSIGGETKTVARGIVNDEDVAQEVFSPSRTTRDDFAATNTFLLSSVNACRLGYVAVFNRALTHEEMRILKYRILDPSWGNDDDTGLWDCCVAQYDLERGAGATLTNTRSPGTHDGTIDAGASWETDPPFEITYRAALSAEASTGQEVEPLATKTSISGCTFEVIDADAWLTAALAGTGVSLIGKNARLVMGFRGLLESENQPVFTGKIEDIGYRAKVYTLEVGDNFFTAKVRQNVGAAATTLSMTNVVTELTYGNSSGDIWWWDAEDTGVNGYLRIEDEIVSYPTDKLFLVFGSAGVPADNLLRGQLGTAAAAHASGVAFREIWQIDNQHPLTIALKLMLSGAGFEATSEYDSYIEFSAASVGLGTRTARGRGLGMSPSDVAIEEIEALRDTHFVGYAFRLYINEPVSDVKELIERELLRPLGCFFFTKSDGRLSIGCHKVPTILDVVHLVGPEQLRLEEWDVSKDNVVNYLEVEYDWNPATEEYDGQYIAADATSGEEYGIQKRDATFNGVDAAYSPTTILDDLATDLLRRFKDPLRKATITCGLFEFLVEIGDPLLFTHYFLPNVTRGTLGLHDQLWQVVGRKPDFRTGRVSLTIVDVSLM